MKKTISIILALLLLTTVCFLLVACGDKEAITYTVTIRSEWEKSFKHKYIKNSALSLLYYDGVWEKREIKENDIVGEIEVDNETAQKKGYKFCGWFVDEACTMAWNTMLDPVRSDMTLYAKWEEIGE